MQQNTWRQLRDAQRAESPSILEIAMRMMERQMPLGFFGDRVQLRIEYSDEEADIIRRVNDTFGSRLPPVHIDPDPGFYDPPIWAAFPRVLSDPADNPLIERVRAPAVIIPRNVAMYNPELQDYVEARAEGREWHHPASSNWDVDTLPAHFVFVRDALPLLRERYPELPNDELEVIVENGVRAYLEADNLETRNRVAESMIVQFYQWEQDHMSHIIESDWPLRLGPQQLQPQQRPEQGAFVEHAEIHDAKLTGNKVSVDDLDELFAKIDKLMEQNDAAEND